MKNIFIICVFNFFVSANDIDDLADTSKEEIKKWRDDAKDFFLNKRSSYYFREPDKKAILKNYDSYYSTLNNSELRAERIKLGRIAFYLRVVKDLLIDPRTRFPVNMYSKFPSLFLKSFDPILEQACSTDFKNCTDAASLRITGTYWFSTIFFDLKAKNPAATDKDRIDRLKWANVTANKFRLYRTPFKDLDEQFLFSMTLTYYFCWFTMLQLPILSFLPYCDYTTKWFSGFAGENIMLDDNWTLVDVLDDEPFRCAQFSFCPDPCCYRTAMIQPDCEEDQLNPCRFLLHKTCVLVTSENDNFVQMVQNGLNKSCRCNAPGYRFESSINECYDIDECETGEGRCPGHGTICFNTVGQYSCSCKLGYSNKTGTCLPLSVLGELKRQWPGSGCNLSPEPFTAMALACIVKFF